MYQFLITEKRIKEDMEGKTESFSNIENIIDETKRCIALLLINKWSAPIIGVEEYSADILTHKRKSFVFVKAISTQSEKYEKLGFKYTPPNVLVELPNGRRVNLFGFHKDYGFISSEIKAELYKNPIGMVSEYETSLSNYAVQVYYDNIELNDAMRDFNTSRARYEESQKIIAEEKKQQRLKEEEAYRLKKERQALSDSLNGSVYDMFRKM